MSRSMGRPLLGTFGKNFMRWRTLPGTIAMTIALISHGNAQIVDFSKYPNLKGQWTRFVVRGLGGQASFDQTKPWGFGQGAPLTPEYAEIERKSLADQAEGGHGNNVDHVRCVASGMPRMMIAFRPIEFVVLPEITYILVGDQGQPRRVFTDGRNWPAAIEPTFAGYSIGRWTDDDGDGRFEVLEVETRVFKGPRDYDTTGLPLHSDNQSIFKERIYLDRRDPNILHDEITVLDNALTRPWTVDKDMSAKPIRSPSGPNRFAQRSTPRSSSARRTTFSAETVS